MAASSTDAISSVTLSLAFLPLAAPISDAKVLTGRQKPLTEVAVLLAEIRAESGQRYLGDACNSVTESPNELATQVSAGGDSIRAGELIARR